MGRSSPGHAEAVGQIVVAGGNHQLARQELGGTGEPVGAVHQERAVGALDAGHGVVLAHVQAIELRDLAVVLQRLLARGLLLRADEGNVADLQQLRRGEEGHVGGVVVKRVDQAALVHGNHGIARALRLDGAGQAGGTGADDEYVELLHAWLPAKIDVTTNGAPDGIQKAPCFSVRRTGHSDAAWRFAVS